MVAMYLLLLTICEFLYLKAVFLYVHHVCDRVNAEMDRYKLQIRNSQIFEAHLKETPLAKIAKKHQLSVRQVYRILKTFEILYSERGAAVGRLTPTDDERRGTRS